METLKVMRAKGRSVLERELTDARGPFLLIEGDDALEFATVAPAGAKVLAALVRDEDGWVLASPDPACPVRSGTKVSGSLPLMPGSACSIGDYVFLLDSDVAASGDILLWRIDKSPIASENAMTGRNVVAADSLRDGVMTVNPAVPGQELFSFYPTAEGLDVVMLDGGRMSIPRRACFAVGGFEGVLLPADEALAALKTSRPFAYPSRHVRRRLLAALVGVIALFCGAAFLGRLADSVERLADAPHGAARVSGKGTCDIRIPWGNDAVYILSLFRDMPVILGPKPTAEARDYIARTANLSSTQLVAQTKGLLGSVFAIQESIQSEDWPALSNAVAHASRHDFVIVNGLPFLEDAQQVSAFANDLVPSSGLRISSATPDERRGIETAITNALAALSGNRFGESESFRSYCARLNAQYDMLNGYFSVSDRIRSHADRLVPSEIDELRAAYLELLHIGDRDMPGLLAKVQADLREFAGRWFESLVEAFDRNPTFGPELSAIGTLYDLSAETETDEAVLKDRKTRLQSIVRRGETLARTAYEKYRLLPYGKSEATLALLDEIIAIGSCAGRFSSWAAEEKRRLTEEEEKK